MGLDWIFGAEHVIVHDKENWAQVDGEYQLDAGLLRSLKFGLRGAEHKRYTDATLNQGRAAPPARLIASPPFAWSQPSACADATGKDDPANSPFASLPALSSSFPGNYGAGIGNGFPTQIGFIPADVLVPTTPKYTNRDPIARRSPNDGGEYSDQGVHRRLPPGQPGRRALERQCRPAPRAHQANLRPFRPSFPGETPA